MKLLWTLLISFLLLSACSDNSNKPEAPAGDGEVTPTVEDLITVCSIDPILLPDDAKAQCEKFKKQQELAELIQICTGDPTQIPANLVTKCLELEKSTTDQLNDEATVVACKNDPTSLPFYIAAECENIIKFSEMSVEDLVKTCKGELGEVPKLLEKKCEEVLNPAIADANFEKNGVSRLTLANLEMKSFDLVEGLEDQALEFANIISKDFSDCGLSLNGSQCVDRRVESKRELGEFVNTSNELVYAVELKYIGVDTPMILVFKQEEKPRDTYIPRTVEVYAKLFAMVEGTELDSYLMSQATYKLLKGEVNAIADNKRYTLNLSEFNSIRPLYHHLVGVISTNTFSGILNPNYRRLMSEINKKKGVIENSDNEIYQLATMILLKDGLKVNENLFLGMARKMVNAELVALKQYVSIYLGLDKPRSDKYRAIILRALEHEYATARLDAMRFLARKDLTSVEKNKMLLMSLDSDNAVREFARTWSSQERMNNENISALTKLTESEILNTRRLSLTLLNRINSPESTNLIINLLNDVESEIRSLAIRFLRPRSVDDSMYQELELALNSPHSEVRSAVIKLLENTKDQKAIVILNNRLIKETNPVVKYELQQAIQKLSN